MPDRTYTIVFQADTSQALAGLKAISSEFSNLEMQMRSMGATATTAAGQMTQVGTNAAQAVAPINGYGEACKSSTLSMVGMQAGFMAVSAGIGVMTNLGDMANQARDRIKELAIETLDLRDKMRELANLKGKEGPDTEILAETVKMGMKAGMMPPDMVKYLEQFEGSSPAGVQKGHIDAKTKDELALEGAKFGSRVKLSPQTAGDLAGVISQYTDLTKDKDGKEIPQSERLSKAMSQMGRIAYNLNEGRGNLEPLTRSLINTAGAVVGGPVEDLAELAAIQGVASTHANPRESGTRVRQAVRALRDTSGEAGGFLTNTAKIKESDTHIQRLEKLKPLIDAARKNGKGSDQYLKSVGFKDEDEIKSIGEEVEDLDIIKIRLAESKKNITGDAVIKADDNFQKHERIGIRRRQMANKAGQEILIGQENERLEIAKENAEQQQRDKHQIGGQWNNVKETVKDVLGIAPALGFQTQREWKKGQDAEVALRAEAKRVGIGEDASKMMLGYDKKSNKAGSWYEDNRGERGQATGFNKLALEVERRGGDPYGKGPDLAPKFDALIEETRETNRLLGLKNQPNQVVVQPAAPAKPAAAPKRP